MLITGGTGTLGGLLAYHLVVTGRTRRLLLASRRGADAPGAAELADRLTGAGAQVRWWPATRPTPTRCAALVADAGASTR